MTPSRRSRAAVSGLELDFIILSRTSDFNESFGATSQPQSRRRRRIFLPGIHRRPPAWRAATPSSPRNRLRKSFPPFGGLIQAPVNSVRPEVFLFRRPDEPNRDY